MAAMPRAGAGANGFSVVGHWDAILLKECERIMATPTPVPNETLRIMKLGDDDVGGMMMADDDDGQSTSSLSDGSPDENSQPAAARRQSKSSPRRLVADAKKVSPRRPPPFPPSSSPRGGVCRSPVSPSPSPPRGLQSPRRKSCSSMERRRSASAKSLQPKLVVPSTANNAASILPPEVRGPHGKTFRSRSLVSRRQRPEPTALPAVKVPVPALVPAKSLVPSIISSNDSSIKKNAGQSRLTLSFLGAEPRDMSTTSTEDRAEPPVVVEDTPDYPDRSALSNFFGTKVDGAQQRPAATALARKLSVKNIGAALPTVRRPSVEDSLSSREIKLIRQDPWRTLQLNDPTLRGKSLEELMMDRFQLKLEDAICLVADARMNRGCNKWQHWGIDLYDECERLYILHYGPLPVKSMASSSTASPSIRPSTPVGATAMPTTYMRHTGGMGQKLATVRRATTPVMGDDTMSSSLEDASGWESTSGWSSLWEDGNALPGGFSRKTYDKNDAYTMDVIQQIERTFLQMEASERQQQQQANAGRRSTQPTASRKPASKKHGHYAPIVVTTAAPPKPQRHPEVTATLAKKNDVAVTPRRRWFFERLLCGRTNK